MRVMRVAAILVMGGTTLVAAAQGQRAETSQGLDASHEKAPTMAWMPRATITQVSLGNCGSWERGEFQNIQVNVDLRGCNLSGDAANEPSIAINPIEPRKVVLGWRQFDSVKSDFRMAGYAYSHDGGHTWLFPGSLSPGIAHSDPVLAADAEGRVYYHTITLGGDGVPSFRGDLFRSLSGGITWLDPVADLSGDKPWMTADRTNSIGTGNLYVCSEAGFAKSSDDGQSFVAITGASCKGGTVIVGQSGLVFVTGGFPGSPSFIRSYTVPDAGTPSFAPPIEFHFPGSRTFGPPNAEGLLKQHWLGTGTKLGNTENDVYLVSLAMSDPLLIDQADIAFIASRDGGVTWNERPVFINDDPLGPDNWQWFPTLCVAPNGRIDMVWNDTRNSQQANLSELFYSYSSDGGRTWSANVPVSPMFDSWVGWPGGNNKLGDYYHCVSDNLGANVAYAATFNGEQDIYFLRIGPWDCNGNEVDDAVDISSEDSSDCNGNEVPDECEYRVDIDGDGLTTIEDFTALAERLATEPQSHQATEGVEGCDQLFDADHDSDIDLADFAYLQRVFVGE